MTDQEIFEQLHITNASDVDKMACLHNINVVVELRVAQALGELLTEDEVSHLEEMEKNGLSKDDMLWWLGENVASAHEMIDAMTRDYVAELAAQQQELAANR